CARRPLYEGYFDVW
nr:immunoglobulin heavy chain junction region [Mus musculus]NSM06258.1 immunoglobulin heavy chain junction region [Mus musculus]